jgi:peroxiredoxin
MVSVGDEFPTFELLDQDGLTHTKKDLIGSRYVVFCYPKDNTGG